MYLFVWYSFENVLIVAAWTNLDPPIANVLSFSLDIADVTVCVTQMLLELGLPSFNTNLVNGLFF